MAMNLTTARQNKRFRLVKEAFTPNRVKDIATMLSRVIARPGLPRA
jgi:hypothetical protein